MTNQSIGEMAGKVWHELNENGEMTAAKLKTKLKTDAFTLNAALGWLAREDKVSLAKSGNTVKASLK
ncbi:MAG: winged helix-turn-helix domain-containing protein [Deferribacteres bacterium]|nr:winged helix-turn-helix domain-containing protein [candidate division KSB1 bacterium]MCB9510086.1 winged helix-turn-helix domain-containing protein [Deferribacteres bacterium]